MAAPTETPVLDTVAAMTLDSIERCALASTSRTSTRPPPQGATSAQVQNVLVAIAPMVGTARVASAAGHLGKVLGFAIAVTENGNGFSAPKSHAGSSSAVLDDAALTDRARPSLRVAHRAIGARACSVLSPRSSRRQTPG